MISRDWVRHAILFAVGLALGSPLLIPAIRESGDVRRAKQALHEIHEDTAGAIHRILKN